MIIEEQHSDINFQPGPLQFIAIREIQLPNFVTTDFSSSLRQTMICDLNKGIIRAKSERFLNKNGPISPLYLIQPAFDYIDMLATFHRYARLCDFAQNLLLCTQRHNLQPIVSDLSDISYTDNCYQRQEIPIEILKFCANFYFNAAQSTLHFTLLN